MNMKLLILFMALTRAGDCQSIYPLLSVSGKDTLCTITMRQLEKINIQLVGLDDCMMISDTMLAALNSVKQVAGERKEVIKNFQVVTAKQDSMIQNFKQIIKSKDVIISNFSDLDAKNRTYQRGLKRTILKWQFGFCAVVIGTIAVLLVK